MQTQGIEPPPPPLGANDKNNVNPLIYFQTFFIFSLSAS